MDSQDAVSDRQLTYRTTGGRRDEKSRQIVAAAVIASFVIAIAALGGLATDPDSAWYEGLEKPAFQPPSDVFSPVWTLLYVMFATSAWLAWRHVAGHRRFEILSLYAINGGLNLAWTLLFFGSEAALAAGIEIAVLLLSIVTLRVAVQPFNRMAAYLLVPYGLWVTFALALNWAIVVLN